MSIPIEQLTPTQIVSELDKYIVGQAAAKRAVAVALRNRFRRLQLPASEQTDVLPKNILMMGPTGVGKTEIARRLAQLARAPFIKVEATKFTEVGYVGRDVDAIVRDLAAAAYRLVEAEKMDAVTPRARARALETIAESIDRAENPQMYSMYGFYSSSELEENSEGAEEVDSPESREARINAIITRIENGELDDHEIEVDLEVEGGNPFVQVFGPEGMQEMGWDTAAGQNPFGGSRSITRTVLVSEAIPALTEHEAKKSIDPHAIRQEALHRAEQSGIIFLDEIDKVASKSNSTGPDVSREGVQRDLLPIIEGSTVQTKYGALKTDHVLFICAGAFHISKPSDLIPELQGRLPIRVELSSLGEDDFRRILTEPKNSLTKQYQLILATDGVNVTFTNGALNEISRLAMEANKKIENIGARRLHTMMEKLLEDFLFEAPECGAKSVEIDAALVESKIARFIHDASADTRSI